MKTFLRSLSIAAIAVMVGMPFVHGFEPSQDKGAFGQAVSELARTYPGAVSDHVAN